jgi:hypothetical protein
MKSIIILATVHENQLLGNSHSSGLENRLLYFKSKLGVQIVMEEWSEKQGESAAQYIHHNLHLQWANIGTPNELQFHTY